MFKGPSLYGGGSGGGGSDNGYAPLPGNNPLGGRPLANTPAGLYSDLPGGKNHNGYAEIPGSKPRRGSGNARGSLKEKPSSTKQRSRSNTTGNIGPRTWGRDSASTAHGPTVTSFPVPAAAAGSAAAAAVGPRDPYDSFTLVLLERLAIGDVGFFTDADLKELQAKGLMAPGVALKVLCVDLLSPSIAEPSKPCCACWSRLRSMYFLR